MRSSFAAEIVAEILGRAGMTALYTTSVRARSLVTVLCLHRVSPTPDRLFPPVAPSRFRELCRHLKRHYQITLFRELRDNAANSSRPRLILSFDDGYRDFLEYAVPILVEEGLKANQNIIVACGDSGRPYIAQGCMDFLASDARTPAAGLEQLGLPAALRALSGPALGAALAAWFLEQPVAELSRVEQRLAQLRAAKPYPESAMLTWDEIREVDRLGIVEIGSHSMTHAAFDVLPAEVLEWQLRESKRRLEHELGHQVDVLAFPGGRCNAAVLEAGQRAGYRDLLAVGDSLNESRPEYWKRILIYAETPWRLRLQASGLESALRRWKPI